MDMDMDINTYDPREIPRRIRNSGADCFLIANMNLFFLMPEIRRLQVPPRQPHKSSEYYQYYKICAPFLYCMQQLQVVVDTKGKNTIIDLDHPFTHIRKVLKRFGQSDAQEVTTNILNAMFEVFALPQGDQQHPLDSKYATTDNIVKCRGAPNEDDILRAIYYLWSTQVVQRYGILDALFRCIEIKERYQDDNNHRSILANTSVGLVLTILHGEYHSIHMALQSYIKTSQIIDNGTTKYEQTRFYSLPTYFILYITYPADVRGEPVDCELQLNMEPFMHSLAPYREQYTYQLFCQLYGGGREGGHYFIEYTLNNGTLVRVNDSTIEYPTHYPGSGMPLCMVVYRRV